MIAKNDVAITSDVPGTTRDLVRVVVNVGGLLLSLLIQLVLDLILILI